MQNDILIKKAANGDEKAFEQLLLENQKQVYNLCFRMTGNADDAMDLSQEAFLKAWKALPQYHFDAAFTTWLYRLTNNVCIDFLRRQKRQSHVSLTFSSEDEEQQEMVLPDETPGPEEQYLQNESAGELERALNSLSADYREILQLRVCEDLPYEEIADILDIKVGTVKSRINRARLQLKKILEDGNFFENPSSNNTVREGQVRGDNDM